MILKGITNIMRRSELREHVFCALFCLGFYPENEREEQLEFYFQDINRQKQEEEEELVPSVEAKPKEREYIKERLCHIFDKLTELDKQIDSVSVGWSISRMGKVDLTIIRLAYYEMLYDESVPVKVAINEAVELAKKFGGESSQSFVNGILAKLTTGLEV